MRGGAPIMSELSDRSDMSVKAPHHTLMHTQSAFQYREGRCQLSDHRKFSFDTFKFKGSISYQFINKLSYRKHFVSHSHRLSCHD